MTSSATYIPRAVLDETLAASPVQGKHAMEPWKSFAAKQGMPAGVIQTLEDHQIENNICELHRHQEDLWISLEGEVEFVVGGTAPDMYPKKTEQTDGTFTIDDKEWKGSRIEGGTRYVLKKGDVLHIPAGVWHVHNTKTTARLFVIKLNASELAPLPKEL